MDEQRFQNYQLLQRLGRSASGDLHRVLPDQGTQQLLLQQLPLALPGEKLAQDLQWTARPVASLGRPAVARIVDYANHDDGTLYLLFENASGEPLQAMIAGAPEQMEPAEALAIAGQLAHVLERGLKAGIIHKLLLPHYLFVSQGQPPTILGLDLPATIADRLRSLLPEEELVFLSPEQRQGNVIDGRSNIYSLGALLYSLLTGEPPLPAGPETKGHVPLAERRPDLAQPTIRLVETCLQPNSWMRFQTYSALRNALDQAAAVESPSDSTAAVTYPVVPAPTRRRPRLRTSLAPLLVVAILFLVAAAVVLGGGAWLLFGGGPLDEMADMDMPATQETVTPTPTGLAPLQASPDADTTTSPPGPTPTLLATSTPESNTTGGTTAGSGGLSQAATPTLRATATRMVNDELIGENGDSTPTATATPPPRQNTPRPTSSPTPAVTIQPPTATATTEPPPPPPPPPAPTATSEPPPLPTATAEPQPTPTHPVPATLPPPTPTPPLPTTS